MTVLSSLRIRSICSSCPRCSMVRSDLDCSRTAAAILGQRRSPPQHRPPTAQMLRVVPFALAAAVPLEPTPSSSAMLMGLSLLHARRQSVPCAQKPAYARGRQRIRASSAGAGRRYLPQRQRYSAREVNIRYGSLVPRVTRSSTITPRYPWCRPIRTGSLPLARQAALIPASSPWAAASS